MKFLYSFLILLLVSCASELEQKATGICACFDEVSHVYGLVPEEFKHMSAEQYKAKIQGEYADSCSQLLIEAIESCDSQEKKDEFFGAYEACKFD